MTREEFSTLRIGGLVSIMTNRGRRMGRVESRHWNGISGSLLIRVSGRLIWMDHYRVRKENRSWQR